MAKHYDVVVLGGGLGALSAAALLARRSWRVLVLGQGYRPASYSYEGLPLARRPFTFLTSSSPAWTRIVAELAQSQTFRRRVSPLDPMFQVLLPGRRLDVPPEAARFGMEIDREFPGVRRIIDDLMQELARSNTSVDAAFERDVVWPPGTFWERRETSSALSLLPHLARDRRHEAPADLLAEFPREHPYRTVAEVPARFSSDAHPPLTSLALARLSGAWTRGVMQLARGEEELVDFLVERITAHGGAVELGERAVAISHSGGKVRGVLIDGDEAPTGVQFVVADLPTRALLDLADGFAPPRRALAALPNVSARARRFVVSMCVNDAGIPVPLGHESFLIPDPASGRPEVHLQRHETKDGRALLVAEAILDAHRPDLFHAAREAVLGTVEEFLPFIERHYQVVDSPHDGRSLWDFRSGKRRSVDRALFRVAGASLDAEPMTAQWEIAPPQLHGLAGEPLRTPLSGAFVVGKTTLPALGQEGELLAAWSAARMITRTDRQKERMRREMWRKIELG